MISRSDSASSSRKLQSLHAQFTNGRCGLLNDIHYKLFFHLYLSLQRQSGLSGGPSNIYNTCNAQCLEAKQFYSEFLHKVIRNYAKCPKQEMVQDLPFVLVFPSHIMQQLRHKSSNRSSDKITSRTAFFTQCLMEDREFLPLHGSTDISWTKGSFLCVFAHMICILKFVPEENTKFIRHVLSNKVG